MAGSSDKIPINKEKWTSLPMNTRIGYERRYKNKILTFKSSFIKGYYSNGEGVSFMRVRSGKKEYSIPLKDVLKLWVYKKEFMASIKGGSFKNTSKENEDAIKKLREDIKLLSGKLDRIMGRR
jgi:hypothetical protein